MGRSMDWTLEDNMVDGLFFCATLTSRRGGHTPFVQAGTETSDTCEEAVKPYPGSSWKGHSGGWWVPVSGINERSLVGLSDHSAFHWWSAHCAARMLLLSDKLTSCWAASTNGCLDLRRRAFALDERVSAEWSRCPGSMARRPWASVAPLRRNSAGWMPARIGMLSAGVGCRHPVTIRKASLMAGSMKRAWALRHQTGAQYSALEWTRARVAVRNIVAPAPQPEPASRLRSVKRDVSFLRSDSRCRRYVSDLSNVTPRYLGSEQKGRVSLLKLTFSSRLASLLLRRKTADTVFVVLSFSFQVWRYSPRVAMSLVSAPSTACQSPSACMIARSSAYAYFLEMVVGRLEMQRFNSNGSRTDPCGTSFLRRPNVFLWPFPVVRVKLRLPAISMIMWTMCQSVSNRSSLQVRPRSHTVS